MIMDIFDIIGTTPPEVTWCIASLFLMLFVGGFGCILLLIIAKHGKEVERNEAREIRRKIKPRWWEEIK